MAVVYLDIHDKDAPNGTVLATLTDADVSEFEMRCGENELGTGTFTIRRDHPDATEANLATGNYIKVRIPQIQVEPVFGFWIDEHDDTLISEQEEGGEFLTRKGWGTLFILAHARLLNDIWSTSHAFRGDYDVPGYWTWAVEPYGAIMLRTIEEGQLEPGEPLGEVTATWTREEDTNGNAWPEVAEEIQFQIGTDGLSVMSTLIESGELHLRAEADLTINAYLSRGEDLTGTAYASDVVRFVKGENILTGLDRSGQGIVAATHSIVVGKDLKYRQVVSPDYVPGSIGRWTTTNYGESNDPTLLDKVGLNDLRKRNAQQQGLDLEFFAGDDPANGRYFPFKHFNTGDRISLDTGSAEWDFQDAPHYVVGFRIVLGEASDDSTAEMEARSLRWLVELNAGGLYSATLPSAADPTGQPCSDCPPLPPRPPFVPGVQEPDLTYSLCNTVSLLVGADRSVVSVPGALDVSGDWYWELENTQHDVAAFTDVLMLSYSTPGAAAVDLIPAMGGVFGVGCNNIQHPADPDHCPYVVLPSGSGTFTIPSGSTGFTFTASSNGYSAPCTSPYVDECWTLRLWRGGVPTPTNPQMGQHTTEAVGGVTSGTDYQTNYPYASGSLRVWVGTTSTSPGVFVTPTEVDPDDGTFELGFDATGQTLTVTYQINDATATGAGNGPPSGTTSAPSSAPTTADFLVGTAQAGLSAEIVVGTSPGGELGGTWASPTVDATHSGSTHDAATNTHIADASDAHDASAISFVPTGTIAATDVQAAIAEVAAEAGSAVDLDDLTDVVVTSPAEDDTLRYIGGVWVNDPRRWEPVTFNFGSGPELVWDGDDLVMEFKEY